MRELWIQSAISHKGSLRAYVARKYGSRGFIKHNGRRTIKVSLLHRLAKKKGAIGKKSRLALTLRRLRR